MTSSEILAASLSRPRVILGDDFESGFKKLMRQWHPDLNKDPGAAEVASKLNLLLQSARRLEANGGYHKKLILNEAKGEVYEYSAEVRADTGPLYVCDRRLIWKTPRSDDDLCRQWLETVKAFKFPHDKMREEFDRVLPKNSHVIGRGESAYTVVSKPREVIRVADILAKYGKIDPKHVAWILSNMYNQACWLSYAEITHFGLTIGNYFVEPKKHLGCLYGGWHFSSAPRARPIAAPAAVKLMIPGLKTMTADEVHLSLIKIAGRQMLGHDSLSTLRRDDTIPQALRDFLVAPGGKRPVDEYRRWGEVIPAAFGGRRFEKYDLTSADVYGD